MVRIIPGLAAGLLIIGTCAWACGLPVVEAGGPPPRPTVSRTLVLVQAESVDPDYPLISPIPTHWDSSTQLLPTEIEANFLLANWGMPLPAGVRRYPPPQVTTWQANPLWMAPTKASRVTTSTRVATLPQAAVPRRLTATPNRRE